MSSLRLLSYPGDFRALKALVAAQYNGVKIALPEFNLEKEVNTPAFRAKSPLGKVPVLETAEGCIFESNAIARYVARLRRDTNLTGASFFDSARVDSWLDFAAHEIDLPCQGWALPVLGIEKFDGRVTNEAKGALKASLAVLEDTLLHNTFLVGERITLADIVVACGLYYPMKILLDAKFRAPFPSVERWFTTLINQPEFIAVFGPPMTLCVTEMVASGASKKAAKKEKGGKAAGAGQGQGKGGKKGKKGGEAAKPKAEEKKEEAPKKAAKPKGPFDGLPKSSLDGDEWKRTYSNTRTSANGYYDSMPKFWEMLDREGWSVWFQTYNYNTDNLVDFQTSNLVGGYIQRCDSLRKFLFGCMAVFDKAEGVPFYAIEGCWLIRGQKIEPMLEANPDAEYYTWTKMNPDDENERKRVADYWCADEKMGDRVVYDSKVFK